MKLLFILIYLFTFMEFNLAQDTKKDKLNKVSLELISDKLTGPVAMAVPKGDTKRIFIAEQTGTIKIIYKDSSEPKTFLDLGKKLSPGNVSYSEKGLLGLAFHPNYKENRLFFVNYSMTTKTGTMDHKTVISVFSSALANPDRAMIQSERSLLEIEQPESNHNGGTILFGPDGKLFIGSGDGGGAGDAHGEIGNAQNLNSLLGKLLRVEIDAHGNMNIPGDNPEWPGIGKNQIYAYGLRNPWKFSFDSLTGKLFLADVGQNKFEEVNIISKSGNYGWKVMEGNHCFNPPEDCNTKNLELPIHEYDHSIGISIIGGYVYRKNKKSSFYGKYIFGDWSGKIFSLKETKDKKWKREDISIDKGEYSWKYTNSFGEDESGNIYILVQDEVGPSKKGYLFKLKL